MPTTTGHKTSKIKSPALNSPKRTGIPVRHLLKSGRRRAHVLTDAEAMATGRSGSDTSPICPFFQITLGCAKACSCVHTNRQDVCHPLPSPLGHTNPHSGSLGKADCTSRKKTSPNASPYSSATQRRINSHDPPYQLARFSIVCHLPLLISVVLPSFASWSCSTLLVVQHVVVYLLERSVNQFTTFVYAEIIFEFPLYEIITIDGVGTG